MRILVKIIIFQKSVRKMRPGVFRGILSIGTLENMSEISFLDILPHTDTQGGLDQLATDPHDNCALQGQNQ